MSAFFDGPGVRGSLPSDFTHEDLLAAGLTEGDTDEVIAFREFLRVAGPVRPRPIKLPQPWYDYATGKITGTEALERVAAALTDRRGAAASGTDAKSESGGSEAARKSGESV